MSKCSFLISVTMSFSNAIPISLFVETSAFLISFRGNLMISSQWGLFSTPDSNPSSTKNAQKEPGYCAFKPSSTGVAMMTSPRLLGSRTNIFPGGFSTKITCNLFHRENMMKLFPGRRAILFLPQIVFSFPFY